MAYSIPRQVPIEVMAVAPRWLIHPRDDNDLCSPTNMLEDFMMLPFRYAVQRDFRLIRPNELRSLTDRHFALHPDLLVGCHKPFPDDPIHYEYAIRQHPFGVPEAPPAPPPPPPPPAEKQEKGPQLLVGGHKMEFMDVLVLFLMDMARRERLLHANRVSS